MARTERAVEETFARVDRRLSPLDLFPVQELVDATDRTERLLSALPGLAAMPLALDAAVVYGVLAYAVRLRAR